MKKKYPPEVQAFRHALKRSGLSCIGLARQWGLHPVTVRAWNCGTVKYPEFRLQNLKDLQR
jgi:hypothetical protein